MYDHEPRQPVLTSHELTARHVGPSRGKQRFEVDRPQASGRDGNRDFGNRREGFNSRPRQDRNDRPARPQRSPKPQSFCHDKLLALYKGKEITYSLLTGQSDTVKLVDLDRYTLLIEDNGTLCVIYKSAIAGLILPKQGQVEGEAA